MSRKAGDWRPIGNTHDRRVREEWMIKTFGSTNGLWVFCHHCARRFKARTKLGRRWEIDRFPVCGHNGGRYVRGNIVVSCKKCNGSRCAKFCRRGAVAQHASSIEWTGTRAVEKAA